MAYSVSRKGNKKHLFPLVLVHVGSYSLLYILRNFTSPIVFNGGINKGKNQNILYDLAYLRPTE